MKKTSSIKLKYIIYIIIILLILELLISIPKKIIYENDVIKIFYNNRVMFDNVVNELDDTDIVIIRKKIWGYQLTINNFKNQEYLLNYKSEKYNKYKKSFDIFNKLGLEEISKYDNNTLFEFNSITNPGMGIVYIKDYDKYIWGHSTNKIKKIEDNWYYVKMD